MIPVSALWQGVHAYGGLNHWILDQQHWGVKVLGQAAGNVSSQCVGILIVHCSCSHQVLFIVQVRALHEELVYKSRVQPVSLPPHPLFLPPFLPQILNFYFLFCETIHLFIPSFWITVFIILIEGMLGGAVYAN